MGLELIGYKQDQLLALVTAKKTTITSTITTCVHWVITTSAMVAA